MSARAAKKAPDAAAMAAAEAAIAGEALEREAAEAAAALKAQQEAEEEAERFQKQQEQDELDVVVVGAVAHVIRRAFHAFYESPQSTKDVAEGGNESRESDLVPRDGDLEDGPSTVSVEEMQEEPQDERVQDGKEAALKSSRADQALEESPFVALARARKDAIQRELEEKHERARSLLKFMEVRQQQAAEADARIAEELSQRGLVIKAQIPVGPTHLRLDDQELRAARDGGADFGVFADSLLHAKTLVAEYDQQRQEASGNVKRMLTTPSRRTAAGEESSESGDQSRKDAPRV